MGAWTTREQRKSSYERHRNGETYRQLPIATTYPGAVSVIGVVASEKVVTVRPGIAIDDGVCSVSLTPKCDTAFYAFVWSILAGDRMPS